MSAVPDKIKREEDPADSFQDLSAVAKQPCAR
jgi:hypothetical protein